MLLLLILFGFWAKYLRGHGISFPSSSVARQEVSFISFPLHSAPPPAGDGLSQNLLDFFIPSPQLASHLPHSSSLQFYEFFKYRKVASSNMSRLEAHAGFFRLLMKGIFDPYHTTLSPTSPG